MQTTKCTSATCPIKEHCNRPNLESYQHQSDLSQDGFCCNNTNYQCLNEKKSV